MKNFASATYSTYMKKMSEESYEKFCLSYEKMSEIPTNLGQNFS